MEATSFLEGFRKGTQTCICGRILHLTKNGHRRFAVTIVRLLWAMVLIIGSLQVAPVIAQSIDPASVTQADISEQLLQELRAAAQPVSFLVILKDQLDVDSLLGEVRASGADALEERAVLYHTLASHAAQSQAALRGWLSGQGIVYRPFYLVNMIEVTGDLSLAEALQTRPEVDRLVRNPAVEQIKSDEVDVVSASPQLWPAGQTAVAIPYGLAYTNADAVWAMGYRGAGVVVASQDTGVEWDHPALRPAYRGWDSVAMTVTHPYNWFDAWGSDSRPARCSLDAQVPCDDQGHGTHTVGTMVGDATGMGDTVLGMAPDARWIGCRNMHLGVGTPASYAACFQFFLAPFPQGGDPFTAGRPELAPNVINNSWGCPPSEGCDAESLRQVVDTVRAAGIFVAASAGNKGMSCASVVDPIAIYDSSFSIGAHDPQGQIASFSSRGPVTIDGSGRRKPDLAAPGVSVRSTGLYSSTNTYLSGTSMAAPHVAGAVALLWSAVPALIGNVDLTEQILLKSAIPAPDNQCESTSTPGEPKQHLRIWPVERSGGSSDGSRRHIGERSVRRHPRRSTGGSFAAPCRSIDGVRISSFDGRRRFGILVNHLRRRI